MVGEPIRGVRRSSTSRSEGSTSRATPVARRRLGDIPFNVFARAISAARVNLNMTRRPHATVAGSLDGAAVRARLVRAQRSSRIRTRASSAGSSLARELVVVESAEEAVAAYRELVADPGQAEEMGRRARERVLDEHTYAHRARRLLELVELGLRRAYERRPKARRGRAGMERGRCDRCASSTRSGLTPQVDVVVVDDASTDETADVAEAHGATVLRLPFNVGIGGAVQTGFKYALAHGYDIAVRLDGDGQHDPAELAKLLGADRARRGRIRHRSRFADGSGSYRPPFARRIGYPRVRATRLAPRRASASRTRRPGSRR